MNATEEAKESEKLSEKLKEKLRESKDFKELVRELCSQNCSISGVGPALVDRICRIDRYPERGGQAIVRESIKQAGGAAANTIYGLASFGEKCSFYTTLGEDADADFFVSSLEKTGVRVTWRVTHPETGRVDIYVDGEGERTFFVHPNAAGNVENLESLIDCYSGRLFYLDPFPARNSFDEHVKIASKSRKAGSFNVLNPGYPYSSAGFERLSNLLRFIDIVIMSRPEFEMLGVDPEKILKFVRILVVTEGEKGSRAYVEGRVYHVPAFRVDKVNVVDTTGAGDAFAAGFLKAMLEGYGVESCLKAGNFVAAYNIQHYGARNFPEWEDVVSVL